MLSNDVKELVNNIKNELVNIGTEFDLVSDELIYEVQGEVKMYPLYDTKGLYSSNTDKMPTISSIVADTNVPILTLGNSLYMQNLQTYNLRWTENYPVKRFYFGKGAGGGISVVVRTPTTLNNWKVQLFDWNNGDDPLENAEDLQVSDDNSFFVLDVWVGDNAPTASQIDAYYKFIGNIYKDSTIL